VSWPTLRNIGGTVKDNIVENTNFYGVEIYSDHVLVENNEIQNCGGYAIRITATDVTVQYNDLHGNNGGILVEDNSPIASTGISVHWNNIEGNTAYGLNNEAILIVDATHNWWGHASGPSGPGGRTNPAGKVVGEGDAVSVNVEWDPWLPQPIRLTPHDPVPPGLTG
jgi:hypothetical protein